MLTAAQLAACMPGAPTARVSRYLAAFNRCINQFAINTPVRQAAFLAQVGHESGSLRATSEIASGLAYTNRKDLGNTMPEALSYALARGAEVGPFYKGHGVIQLTGYYNHLAYSLWAYDDTRCVELPDMLTIAPDAIISAGWFWDCRSRLNEVADLNTEEGFMKMTRRINGGYNGLSDRKHRWRICKEVLGA